MKKTKREFILSTLLPFKKDPSTCGYENSGCVYLASNGNKCAVGKHMKEGAWQKECSATYGFLLTKYKKEDFLTDEALEQDLTYEEWETMQHYHDRLAASLDTNIPLELLEDATGLKFPELAT